MDSAAPPKKKACIRQTLGGKRRGIVAEEDGSGGKVREHQLDYAIPGSKGNPSSKYCGISYKEACWFFHLPANKSIPCPDGDDDSSYVAGP